jgi:benzil reductase ((S)-benzoin forming)
MIDLQGKTVVITGASRGIGAGIARECLRRGMNVAVCARDRPALDDMENTLSMAADVRDPSSVEQLANAAVERFAAIDLWINNAGVLEPVAPLRLCSSEQIRAHLDVNVMGVVHGTQSFIRHLRSREGEGVLINISSGASTTGYAGWSAYCAGKAAVDRITECVQLEEEDSGLRAYAVAPGIIDTDMQSLIRSFTPEQFPMVQKFHDLKRDDAFSSVEFVAQSLLAVAFDPAARPSEVCTRLPVGK